MRLIIFVTLFCHVASFPWGFNYNFNRREELAEQNKLKGDDNTYVAGGAGEGKQKIGESGELANKQVAIPEIGIHGYDTPPNPCPGDQLSEGFIPVKSIIYPNLKCSCAESWKEAEDKIVDCTQSSQCCLPNMPNTATFVNSYQEVPKSAGMGGYGPDDFHLDGLKRTSLVAKKSPRMSINKRGFNWNRENTGLKQRRINPYISDTHMRSLVAKKSPQYAVDIPAM